MAEVVLVEVEGGIATVTMNRPERRNALNRELVAALHRVSRDLDDQDNVDVVVLTGADPAFCAGVDLDEVGRGDTTIVSPSGEGMSESYKTR